MSSPDLRVGWSLREDMTRDIVIDALRMAWFKRHPGMQAGLIFHSDRGSQYASHDFRAMLAGSGITSSMSRKGTCWDNACSETLFGSLKVERLHGYLALQDPARGEGRNHRLAALVQPRSAAFDAGLRQPHAVRAGLACESTKASQLMSSAMGYGFQGQGQIHPVLRPLASMAMLRK
jgi:transposase InsO family protein